MNQSPKRMAENEKKSSSNDIQDKNVRSITIIGQ